jgi:hypothetical protein
MFRTTTVSNDVIFDETFQSALAHTVAVRNKDGDLLREFPLYTSPLTHHMRTDWTGTILDQVGTAHLQTFSTDEPPAPIIPAPRPAGVPTQLVQPSYSDLETLDSTEAFAGSASVSSFSISSENSVPSLSTHDLAYLSVLFEGGGLKVLLKHHTKRTNKSI